MEDASREQAEVFVDAEDVGQAGHGLGGQAEAHICQAGHAGVVLSHRPSHTCAPGTGRVVRRDKPCADEAACVRKCRASGGTLRSRVHGVRMRIMRRCRVCRRENAMVGWVDPCFVHAGDGRGGRGGRGRKPSAGAGDDTLRASMCVGSPSDTSALQHVSGRNQRHYTGRIFWEAVSR